MLPSDYSKADDDRWSNDHSPVAPSDTIWLFEEISARPVEPSLALKLNRSPQLRIILHAFRKSTGQHNQFLLPKPTAFQVALLDLEYWSSVTNPNQNENRIARYLERLRSDLWIELSQYGDSFETRPQPETTKPWAIRMNHAFDHSFCGRGEYLQKCQDNTWTAYSHEDPTSYGKVLFFMVWIFLS
jgi:hypothetical protein